VRVRPTHLAAGAALLLALGSPLLAACGGSSGPTTQQGGQPAPTATETSSPAGSAGRTQTVAGVTANVHGAEDATDVKSLEVQAEDFYFEPSIINGRPGQHLTLHITNEGNTEHNFTVQSQQINSDIAQGKAVTVRVVLPKTGIISFFCKYHESRGMAGGLAARGADMTH
jgi:plastocyanin